MLQKSYISKFTVWWKALFSEIAGKVCLPNLSLYLKTGNLDSSVALISVHQTPQINCIRLILSATGV